MALSPVGPKGISSPEHAQASRRAAADNPRVHDTVERFGDALLRALGHVDRLQRGADRMAESFALGKHQDVADLMIATQQAHVALQFTVQVRNKALEAYQEIIRMQI